MKRIDYIDIAKCFAILCVVIGHVLCYDLYGFEHAWKESALMQFIYSFHMPLFIFLSGIVSVTMIERKNLLRDIMKRGRTLLVPFVVVGGIYSLRIKGNLQFIFNDMKIGYWYLWVLFAFYLLSYPLAFGGGKWKYVIAIAIWFIARHFVDKVPETINDTLSLGLMARYYPYFLLGNYIKQYDMYKLMFGNSYVFYLSAMIWASASFLSFRYSDYITTTAAILVIVNICKKVDDANYKIKSSLLYIGKNTLYIYVFHYFALQMMTTVYFNDFLCQYSNITMDLLFALVPTVFAVAFCLGVKLIVQREPLLMRWVFGKCITK